jgi:hypothetical protein
MTHLVDYVRWHEHDAGWLSGSGLLASATYGEINRLWSTEDSFVPYEARLLRFMKCGGETRRVFVVGSELVTPAGSFALHRTLLRHERLKFRPRVHSVLDLRREIAKLGIDTDMFGVLNSKIAYLLQFRGNGPLMLRTTDGASVTECENRFQVLWKDAESYTHWRSRFPDPPPAIKKQVERDCIAVRAVARVDM